MERGCSMADETFYKKMLENLYDGVYFVDVNRKITFWNKGGAERISGFPASQVVGSHCYNNILNHIDLEGHRLCHNGCPLHATIVDGGETRETEVFLHHKDGYRVPVFVRTMPYYENNEIIGAVEIFVDNSERLEIINHMKKLESLAMTDELSGLPNRRYAKEYLSSKLNEYKALGIEFGIAFLDIDDFKRINDKYGHDIGDEVIKMISRTCTNALRKTDLMARWGGGEEFIMIFVGVDPMELGIVSEKMRFLIEHSVTRSGAEGGIKPTVSIGGATMVTELDDSDSIVNRADATCIKARFRVRTK